mgnify:CR=1 FL=1
MLFTRSVNKNLILCVITLFVILPFNANAILVGTYTSPPFSMNEDGEDIGLATESLRALLDKSGIKDYKIIDYPLARGMVELKYGRIDILYPYVTFLKKSKEEYILIGPISKYRVSLFVRKDYIGQVSIDAMKDLALGAERGSIGDKVLAQHNINVEQSTQEVSCLKMVLAERIVACAMGTLSGKYAAAINNIYEQLRYVETDFYADMYLALGPSVPSEVVKKLQTTFKELKRENYFEKQQLDYEHKFNIFIKSLS